VGLELGSGALPDGCDDGWFAQRLTKVWKVGKVEKVARARYRRSLHRSLLLGGEPVGGLSLNVKHELLPNGKPAKNRGTRTYFVVQSGAFLLFRESSGDAKLVGDVSTLPRV
jgi:hypothetical protein